MRIGPVFIGKRKDGGPESHVTGWFIEWKAVATLCLLRFAPGSRDAYHSHAFHAVSWLLRGVLDEFLVWGAHRCHRPSVVPIITARENMHLVASRGTSWVLSLRGRWEPCWCEQVHGQLVTLGAGRGVVAVEELS